MYWQIRCLASTRSSSLRLMFSISAVRHMDATAERNRVPFPTGHAVIFSARTMCGLHCGPLLW